MSFLIQISWMRAFFFMLGIVCSAHAQSPDRLRLRDLYEEGRNQTLKFRIPITDEMHYLPGPGFIFQALKDKESNLLEITVYVRNSDGRKEEITGKSPEEILKTLQTKFQTEKLNSLEMEGDELIFGHYEAEKKEAKIKGLIIGQYYLQSALAGNALKNLFKKKNIAKTSNVREIKARESFLGKCRRILSKMANPFGRLDDELAALASRNGISADKYALGEIALAWGLQLTTPQVFENQEQRLKFKQKQRPLYDQVDLWTRLSRKSESTPLRSEEMAAMIPTMLNQFETLELSLSSDIKEQLDSFENAKTGKLQMLMAKLQKKISEDQNALRDQALLARLDKTDKEKKELLAQVVKINDQFNHFPIRVESKDLRAYQEFRRQHLSEIKPLSEMDEDEAKTFTHFELALQEAYYLYLYRDEFDKITDQVIGSLATPKKDKPLSYRPRYEGLSDALKKAAGSSKFLSEKNTQAAYDSFRWKKFPANSIDAILAELGFLQSLPPELQENSSLQNRKAKLEHLIELAKQNDFEEMSSLLLDQMRHRWEREFQAVIVGTDDERLAKILAPEELGLSTTYFEQNFLMER
jgi:hypothetical protein